MFEGNVYIEIVLPFAGFPRSAERSESKLNSVKSRHFRLYDLCTYSLLEREEIDSRSRRCWREIVVCGKIISSIRFEDIIRERG